MLEASFNIAKKGLKIKQEEVKMKKKGARECVVVTVASKYVSDELFQRLGHEAY